MLLPPIFLPSWDNTLQFLFVLAETLFKGVIKVGEWLLTPSFPVPVVVLNFIKDLVPDGLDLVHGYLDYFISVSSVPVAFVIVGTGLQVFLAIRLFRFLFRLV